MNPLIAWGSRVEVLGGHWGSWEFWEDAGGVLKGSWWLEGSWRVLGGPWGGIGVPWRGARGVLGGSLGVNGRLWWLWGVWWGGFSKLLFLFSLGGDFAHSILKC